MSVTPEQIKNQLEDINKKVGESIQAVNEEVQKHGKIGRENAKALDDLKGNIEEVTARVLDIEQQGTSQNDIENNVKSVGAEFTDSEPYNQFAKGQTSKASFNAENNTVIGSDDNVAPDRRGGVIPGAFRKLRVLDVIQSGTTTSNAVEYTRENTWVNNAAETAEGDFEYPESDIAFELKSIPVRNIGHHIHISKQMVEDAPLVTSYINGRLTFGVEFRKDFQALNGDNSGQNLDGLLRNGNSIQFVGASSGDDQYTNVRRAIAQVELADYMAEFIFLNPADCAEIDLITASDGHFLSANPRMQNIKMLWGLPVIETNAMARGRFQTGSYSVATQFTTRKGTTIEMSESDGDNFTKDMVTIKATARGAMEIWLPASLVTGDLVTPASL